MVSFRKWSLLRVKAKESRILVPEKDQHSDTAFYNYPPCHPLQEIRPQIRPQIRDNGGVPFDFHDTRSVQGCFLNISIGSVKVSGIFY